MRLQKYMANCGVASRRKSEELILQGRVRVNGNTVTELGFKVESGDVVEFDDKRISPEEEMVYIVLNKPAGYVTTSDDQFGRKTVLDLVEGVDARIYPVGRLDYETTGLIILTNDGEFTHRMTHPSHEITKRYIAKVRGIPSEKELKMFREGLKIEDYVTAKAKIKVLRQFSDESLLEIEIHEGRNRQVRKMCEAIGHTVKSLRRVQVGSVKLGELEEGQWRYMRDSELEKLNRQ
jgi:23S rRNA pseudouridine2605 synthase